MGYIPEGALEQSVANDQVSKSVLDSPYTKKGIKSKRMQVLGGPMNMEELRMNKKLLREISKLKKGEGNSPFPNSQLDNNRMELE